jgi:hypothetical protein
VLVAFSQDVISSIDGVLFVSWYTCSTYVQGKFEFCCSQLFASFFMIHINGCRFVCIVNVNRYDCYLTKEPAVFESMALVHSRIRRVYFSVVNKEDGGLGGTGIQTSIYCLPGTNHRYRAFKCCDEERNELYTKCRDLHPEND